jgi:hypothetical protein
LKAAIRTTPHSQLHPYNNQQLIDMQDSPLSITASIAGILTFVGAICASIWVRYNTVRNGRDEFALISASMRATSSSRRVVSQQAQLSTPFRDAMQALNVAPANQAQNTVSNAPWPPQNVLSISESLAKELDGVETDILAYLDAHISRYEAKLQEFLPSLQKMLPIARGGQEPQRIVEPTAKEKWKALLDALWTLSLVILWSVPLRVFSLGMSRVDLRWYTERKEVRKLLERRESLRSQLLFHQVSVAAE